MNVYDFDKTIYLNDSSTDFIIYCMKKKPWLAYKLPAIGWAFLQYKRGKALKDRAKEQVFSIIRYFQPIDQTVAEFWRQHRGGIARYYLAQKQPTDVVISASPEFLLRGICKELGVHTLIGSLCDTQTGKWLAPNCYGQEKVVRYRAAFGDTAVEAFYSDSLSDSPMAEIAHKAYLVAGETLSPWPQTNQ